MMMNRNIILLTLINLTGVVVLWGAIVVVFSFFPLPLSPYVEKFFPMYQHGLEPERDIFFFRLFVAMAIAGQGIVLWIFRRSLDSTALTARLEAWPMVRGIRWVQALGQNIAALWKCTIPSVDLRRFLIAEGILLFVFLSALFKAAVYPHRPQLAQHAAGIVGVILLLNTILWKIGDSALKKAGHIDFFKSFYHLGQVLIPLTLALLIYVPDYEAACARMFLGEQFHHTNAFIMAPGWAHVSGAILNVDVSSRYGTGVVIMIADLANCLGGYSYESVFVVVMLLSITYFLLWYLLWRRWFGSVLLSAVGLILAIKWQMFHTEMFPLAYTYSNATPARCFWDVAVLFLILSHITTHQRRWLVGAGLMCGFMIFYSTGDGGYLTMAFWGYLALHALVADFRGFVFFKRWGWRALGVYAALPFASALLFFWLAVGHHLFTAAFWQNMGEFMVYYASAFGSTPMIKSFLSGHYAEFFTGLWWPLLYVFTLLSVGSLLYFKKLEYRYIFIAFVAMYGLAAYHYYAVLSNTTSYYRNGVVMAFVVCFWIWWLMRSWPQQRRQKWQACLLAGAFYALVTTHNFVAFPNIFNVSKNPMIDPLVADVPMGRSSYFNHLFISYPDAFKLPLNSLGERDEKLVTEKDFQSHQQLKEFYRREFDYSADAALIRSLIPEGGKVPLISSFETKILIQAKRKPFFYCFEMVNSRPRRMRIFVVTHLYTTDNLNRAIAQLAQEKPPYLFMERIFLTPQVPQAYFYDSMDLMELLKHVFTDYEPYQYGEYLVAMKRKEK